MQDQPQASKIIVVLRETGESAYPQVVSKADRTRPAGRKPNSSAGRLFEYELERARRVDAALGPSAGSMSGSTDRERICHRAGPGAAGTGRNACGLRGASRFRIGACESVLVADGG
jgi:hypothetical protein